MRFGKALFQILSGTIFVAFLFPSPSLALPEIISAFARGTAEDYSYSQIASSFQTEIQSVFSRLYPQYDVEQNEPLQCVTQNDNVLPFVIDSMFSLRSVGYTHLRVDVTITNDAFPNAYALLHTNERNDDVKIVLTIGLLRLVNSESELAFILAHEMAHLRLEHFSPHVPALILNPQQLAHIALVHQSWELDADREALEVLRTAGFEPQAALALLERLAATDRGPTDRSTDPTSSFFRHHPAIEERLIEVRARLGLYQTEQAKATTADKSS